jgi:hypothetical protein
MIIDVAPPVLVVNFVLRTDVAWHHSPRIELAEISLSILAFPALALEHDPEKWKPVFRKDHAQTKS